LLPLALVGLLVVVGERPRIEADLTARTDAALDEQGYSFARSGFGGRDNVLTGEAVDQDERQQAIEAARKVWGVRDVEDRIALIDEVKPYVWSARLEGKRVRLDGFVPNETMRKSVLDAVRERFPGAEVEDRMRLGRGEPRRTTMAEGIRFGFEQLARLKSGEVKLQDLGFSVTGEARSSADYKALGNAVLRNLPRGVQLSSNDVRAPVARPFTFNVTLSDGNVLMEGFVPDERSRSEILDSLKRRLPRSAVTDLSETAAGAPEQFTAAVRSSIDHLAMLEEGSAAFTDRSLSFTGQVEKEETAIDAVDRLKRALPRSYRLSDDVKFRAARIATLDTYDFSARADAGKITFEGHVPSDEVRDTLLAEARRHTSGSSVADLTQLARGEPEGFEDAARSAIEHLFRLKRGAATFSGGLLSFEGETETEEEAAEVAASLRGALPRSFTLEDRITFAKARVPTVDNYAFTAGLSEGALVLEGHVPSEEARARILAEAKRRLPKAKVADLTELARGEPERFDDVVRTAIEHLGRLKEGKATVSTGRLSFEGRIGTEDEADEVVTSLRKAVPRSFSVDDKVTFEKARIRIADPYTWSARLSESGIVLEGHVPDEAMRGALVAEARRRAPGGQVEDRMELARGEPAAFEAAARASLRTLGRLRSGEARLEGRSIGIEGTTADAATASSASAEMRAALPTGYALDDRIVAEAPAIPTVRPYVFGADYADGRVVLEGHVPDESVRAALIARAARAMPGVEIDDRLELALGHPGTADDWRNAAGFAIDQLGAMKQGRVRIEDDRYSISGEAADEAGYDAVIAQLARPPRGVKVVERNITRQSTDIYDWRLTATGSRIEIEGHVPSADTRRRILDYVGQRFSGREVADNMKLTGGVPEPERDWLGVVQTGIRAVSIIGEGSARVYGRELEVTGETNTQSVPDRIATIVRDAMPAGYSGTANVAYVGPSAEELAAEAARKAEEERQQKLAEEQAKADEEKAAAEAAAKARAAEYQFDAIYDGLRLELDGAIPSEDDRTTIMSAARRKLPDRNVVDRLEVRDGAPDGWVDAILKSFDPLALLESGRIRLRIGSIKLSGETDNEATLARARKMIESSLPEGFAAENEVAYVAPPAPSADDIAEQEAEEKVDVGALVKSGKTLEADECQAVLNSIVRKGQVLFSTASYELDSKSRGTLKALPKIAKRCPDMRITIEGHTDSDGAGKYNQWLSERRAEAVVEFLTASGVDASVMTAVGYGENKPIARNDTARNKARNRRIEFEVSLR
jgi:outer membrane protein OmpA-like peptidoglycan-associated protein/osmotically-inducible protein OsmY